MVMGRLLFLRDGEDPDDEESAPRRSACQGGEPRRWYRIRQGVPMKPKTSRGALVRRSLPLRFGLTLSIGLLLVGCGKHYWSKPGSADSDFNRDSLKCARENSVQMTPNKDYGLVIADPYEMCLKARLESRTSARAGSSRLVPRHRGGRSDAVPIADAGPGAFTSAALVDDAPADDGHVGGDVADAHLGARQWIVGQHRQIGELAGHDRALLILLECEVGALQDGGPERIGARQALRGPDDAARDAADARDGLPHRPEERRRHVVGRQRHVDARRLETP